MKIKITIICILLSIGAIMVCLYKTKIENIKFNADEIYRVNIIGCGSIGLNTDDKVKITQVVKYFNSIVYYKKSKPQTHNNSPEAKVVFFDKNDKILDKIEFYGDLVEYHNSQYRVILFMDYDKLENLCNN
ncbi:MAG: hypothetical protein ACOYWZ_15420 [Bacillota bacterium]